MLQQKPSFPEVSNLTILKLIKSEDGSYQYNSFDLIGEGSGAKVYWGVRLEDGWQVAVKVVALDKLINRQNVTLLKGEIKISKMIKHPNIVEVFDIVQSLNNIYIISELCEGGDLKQLFSQRNGLTELEALRLISDVFAGLKYLFSKNIIHWDLKPANILIKGHSYKLTDFGYAKQLS